jgi:hypothetical protein
LKCRLWWQCYEELLEKFSGSASLHHDYANFCEAVLNDEARAIKFRQGADILESGSFPPFSTLRWSYGTNQALAHLKALASASAAKSKMLISIPDPTIDNC